MSSTTGTTRRALTVAASLATVGVLAACGATEEAGASAPASEESATAQGDASPAQGGGDTTDDAGATGTDDGAATGGDAGGEYVDGTYTATGSYVSPGGEESVEVALTLADGVVSDVEVTSLAKHPNSERFQGEFISGITDVVVGVPIDELAVDKVAGSSLTSGGFNAAVEDIKGQARA